MRWQYRFVYLLRVCARIARVTCARIHIIVVDLCLKNRQTTVRALIVYNNIIWYIIQVGIQKLNDYAAHLMRYRSFRWDSIRCLFTVIIYYWQQCDVCRTPWGRFIYDSSTASLLISLSLVFLVVEGPCKFRTLRV